MIDMVNLILTEGLLYYIGQFTLMIDTSKSLFIKLFYYTGYFIISIFYYDSYKLDTQIRLHRYNDNIQVMN